MKYFHDGHGIIYRFPTDRMHIPSELISCTEEEADTISKEARAADDAARAARFEASNTYAAKRGKSYPPITDYLDGIVKQTSSDPAIVASGDRTGKDILCGMS